MRSAIARSFKNGRGRGGTCAQVASERGSSADSTSSHTSAGISAAVPPPLPLPAAQHPAVSDTCKPASTLGEGVRAARPQMTCRTRPTSHKQSRSWHGSPGVSLLYDSSAWGRRKQYEQHSAPRLPPACGHKLQHIHVMRLSTATVWRAAGAHPQGGLPCAAGRPGGGGGRAPP